jgi:hypothetical protein
LLVVNSTADDTIVITGWAAIDNSVAGAVFIVIDGQIAIPTLYGLSRPDVAESLRSDNVENSGFVAMFSSSLLRPGYHAVTLEIVSENAAFAYVSPEAAALTVQN